MSLLLKEKTKNETKWVSHKNVFPKISLISITINDNHYLNALCQIELVVYDTPAKVFPIAIPGDG